MTSIIKDKQFEGERPLYASHDLELDNIKIMEGESAIKECSNITANNSEFIGMYPFWIIDDLKINNCVFREGARAALWYLHNVEINDTLIASPKALREIDDLTMRNVKIPNAVETLWHCNNIKLQNCEVANADYLFFHSNNIEISDYKQQGKYSFQYCKNITIRNAEIHTKDAFWNTENVTIYDSLIEGEYLAWHSKNVTFINCTIKGTQPLCYAEDLKLVDCKMADDADLAFEYSNVNATIKGNIVSVKNPSSGSITADSIGEIIIDENMKAPGDCKITTLNSSK